MAIYLARAVEYRIFKIGYSQTPESRVASISGGFPVEVTLHRVFEDGCRSDERNAHEHLRDFHVRAEWYSDEGLRVAEDLFEDLDDSLAKAGAECAAAYVGINIRRCRALWNRESRTILAVEIQQLEAARARISERLLTKDMHDHASHLEIRAARLATDDSNLHREEIARLRRMAQRSRDFASDLGA